ncbi:hypothetical protein PAAG_07974 [Paracoccidioides lutzii Pb01]|uniref:Protein kinase domain-containing protein n=1 Tax=Paracoccidioides lutzii (strain ATCC MYA-826 / Pb01) TaxID=502779 RepID=C1HB33_PARBA|nr:hypothetical protein PAAG_07974 [Paracoccidioides lutzii Pb01]EEH37556.2 hypothetical protein PAAG_07974 [Paracoccidioides lutzii Pb01]
MKTPRTARSSDFRLLEDNNDKVVTVQPFTNELHAFELLGAGNPNDKGHHYVPSYLDVRLDLCAPPEKQGRLHPNFFMGWIIFILAESSTNVSLHHCNIESSNIEDIHRQLWGPTNISTEKEESRRLEIVFIDFDVSLVSDPPLPPVWISRILKNLSPLDSDNIPHPTPHGLQKDMWMGASTAYYLLCVSDTCHFRTFEKREKESDDILRQEDGSLSEPLTNTVELAWAIRPRTLRERISSIFPASRNGSC